MDQRQNYEIRHAIDGNYLATIRRKSIPGDINVGNQLNKLHLSQQSTESNLRDCQNSNKLHSAF